MLNDLTVTTAIHSVANSHDMCIHLMVLRISLHVLSLPSNEEISHEELLFPHYCFSSVRMYLFPPSLLQFSHLQHLQNEFSWG